MATSYNSSDDDDVLCYSNKVKVAFGKNLPYSKIQLDSDSDVDEDNPVMKALERRQLIDSGGTPSKQQRTSSPESDRGRSPTPPPPTYALPGSRSSKARGCTQTQRMLVEQIRQNLLSTSPVGMSSLDSSSLSLGMSPELTFAQKPINIKLRIHGCVKKYSMLQAEKFSSLISRIALAESANANQICLNSGDYQIIPAIDSPQSLGITVADIIECLVLKENHTPQESNVQVTLKIQAVGKNSMREYKIDPTTALEGILASYCKDCSLERKKCTFYFDGFVVDGKQSVVDIDAEDGDVLDVRQSQ